MKYVFCVLALLIQPLFAWIVYHRQDKKKAALKIPLLFCAVGYLVIQVYVFIRVCIRMPDKYQMYSYLLQGGILFAFIVVEIALVASNKYIKEKDQKEQDSIAAFKFLIQRLEQYKAQTKDEKRLAQLEMLLEQMKYSDPVSSPEAEEENNIILQLIDELSEVTEDDIFALKCDEIKTHIELRKIKTKKERG